MELITAKNLADGYRVGAILVNDDLAEWLGALANDMDWEDWLDLPAAETADMRDAAMLKHMPERADAEGGIVVLSDGKEVRLRAMRTRDRWGIPQDNPIEWNCAVISRVSGLPLETVRGLAVSDYAALVDGLNSFQ